MKMSIKRRRDFFCNAVAQTAHLLAGASPRQEASDVHTWISDPPLQCTVFGHIVLPFITAINIKITPPIQPGSTFFCLESREPAHSPASVMTKPAAKEEKATAGSESRRKAPMVPAAILSIDIASARNTDSLQLKEREPSASAAIGFP